MKKGLVITTVLLLAAGGAAAGWYFYNDQSWNLEYFENLYKGMFEEDKGKVYVTDVATLTGKNSKAGDRFAGVVEPQSTVSVNLESNRRVSEVKVQEGDSVKEGQLLFEYDLSSIEQNLQTAQLDMERLQNEALSYQEQIAQLEKEKKKAKANAQLSYTIEIETNKMNLKKNEYDQKAKQAEIERLQNATTNTQVVSEIDGIIQKIDTSKLSTGNDDDSVSNSLEESYGYTSDDSNNAFITILSTGSYRVKGKVNELNRDKIVPGSPVLIRSRVNEDDIWRGSMGYIDTQASKSENENGGYYDASSDSQTSSTTYPFYVELFSSDGLMLGQHVYIEMDVGQEEVRDGLWLSEDFVVEPEEGDPFVWMAASGNKLIRQTITVGEYDPYQMEYEILDGLTEDDYIAFPSDQLVEGMTTIIGSVDQTRDSMLLMEEEEDEESDDEESDDSEEYDDFEEYDESEEYDDSGEYIDEPEYIVEDGDYILEEDDGVIVEDTTENEDDYSEEVIEEDFSDSEEVVEE